MSFKQILGSYSTKNIARVLLEVIEEFEITIKNIGFFIYDNITSNDGAVDLVLISLFRDKITTA